MLLHLGRTLGLCEEAYSAFRRNSHHGAPPPARCVVAPPPHPPALTGCARWGPQGKVGKGTGAFGKRRNKTHTLCRRCGRRSMHVQKGDCSSCGYPAARIRKCTPRASRALAIRADAGSLVGFGAAGAESRWVPGLWSTTASRDAGPGVFTPGGGLGTRVLQQALAFTPARPFGAADVNSPSVCGAATHASIRI